MVKHLRILGLVLLPVLMAGLAPTAQGIDLTYGWWVFVDGSSSIHPSGCYKCKVYSVGYGADYRCWHVGNGEDGFGIFCANHIIGYNRLCDLQDGYCTFRVVDGGIPTPGLTADQCLVAADEDCPAGGESCSVLYE